MTAADLPTLGWLQPPDLSWYCESRQAHWVLAGPVVVDGGLPGPWFAMWVALTRLGDLLVEDGEREHMIPLARNARVRRVDDTVEMVSRSGETVRVRAVVEADIARLSKYAFNEFSSTHPATAVAEAFGWRTR